VRWQRSVFWHVERRHKPRYAEAVRRLGRALAERDATVVYIGTVTELMYHAAAAARERGGRVIGVISLEVLCRQLG